MLPSFFISTTTATATTTTTATISSLSCGHVNLTNTHIFTSRKIVSSPEHAFLILDDDKKSTSPNIRGFIMEVTKQKNT